MRFISYVNSGKSSWGAVVAGTTGDAVVDLSHLAPSLKAAIEGDLLNSLELGNAPAIPLQGLTLLPPITAPGKILCIGVNYANRNAEYKDGSEAPANPSVFIRFADSFTGHDQPLLRPPESEQLDYEGEIVVIIGKSGRRIKK